MPSQIPDLFSCIGTPASPVVWGQTLQLPEAYAVLEVGVTSGDAREEGISILTRLSRMVTRSSLSRFEISNIMRQVGGEEIKSLVLIIPRGEFVTIAIRGSGQVLMRRGKTFAVLLRHQGIITGLVKPGDILLLLSQQAVNAIVGQESALFSENLLPKEIAAALSIKFAETNQFKGVPTGLVVAINTIINQSDQPKINTKKARTYGMPRYKFANLKLVIAKVRSSRQLQAKVLAGFCILFFMASVGLGIYRQQTDTKQRAMRQAIDSAEKLLEQGSALVDINPDDGKTVLLEAQNVLTPFTGANLPKGKDGKKISDLQAKIQDNLQLVFKVYEQQPQLFYDADFLQKGRIVSKMAVGEDEVALVDVTTGMVGIVSIPSKNGEIVTGGEEYKQVHSLMVNSLDILLSTKDSVIKLEAGEKTGKKVLDFGVPIDIATTFAGNLYGVDKNEGDVWRYSAKTTSYSDKNAYFQIDINPDLQSITNISIDGSVWMGSTIGKIFRYTQGRDDPFLVRGLEPTMGNKLQVWASTESDFVYVLDEDNHRVVIFNKSGVYKAQYVYPETFKPTEFGVSERNRKVFLLEQGKIYSIGVE